MNTYLAGVNFNVDEISYLIGNDFEQRVDKETHPFTCLAFSWSRCFTEHAKDFVLRKKLSFYVYFAIEKISSEDGREDEELKNIGVKFYNTGIREKFDDKEIKALRNLVKICGIYKILQNSCKEEVQIKFI